VNPTPPPDETEAAQLYDALTENQRHAYLASVYGVHTDAIKAMSLVDLHVANILAGTVQQLRNLEHLHPGDLTIAQTINGVARLNPLYIHDAIHQETGALLNPPEQP